MTDLTFRGWGDRLGAGGGGGAARSAGGGGPVPGLTEAIQQGEVELMCVLLLVASQGALSTAPPGVQEPDRAEGHSVPAVGL